tara:strand:- start:1595 stop:2296 length:702 start_codon:yes stop_codon:yes gene_type:complete
MTYDFTQILPGLLKNVLNALPVRTIHSYEQGVKFSWGSDTKLIKDPWVYLYCPFFQSIRIEDIRKDSLDLANSSVETKDDEDCSLSGIIKYRIVDARECLMNFKNLRSYLEMSGRGYLTEEARDYSKRDNLRRGNSESLPNESVLVKMAEAVGNESLTKSLESEQDINTYEGNGESDQTERIYKDLTEIKERVLSSLQEEFSLCGVDVYDIRITDKTKTFGLRHFQDLNTVEE